MNQQQCPIPPLYHKPPICSPPSLYQPGHSPSRYHHINAAYGSDFPSGQERFTLPPGLRELGFNLKQGLSNIKHVAQ